MVSLLPQQLLALASTFHEASVLLFGYFFPALSSVKGMCTIHYLFMHLLCILLRIAACLQPNNMHLHPTPLLLYTAVVRKDSEAYHQWTTYWLILHLYITIISPVLHLTLHPAFQIIAILWLSLPQYQGASVVYDRIVNPWVDMYESQVDEGIGKAHSGVRRWMWKRFGGVVWMMLSEGGSLTQGILSTIVGLLGGEKSGENATDASIQPSNSTESLPPRHSIKEAMSQSSSIDKFDGVGKKHSLFDNPTEEFVKEFMSMLEQGLYVFANIVTETKTDETTEKGDMNVKDISPHVFEGGFKLGIFSYSKEGNAAFIISPVSDVNNANMAPVRLPLHHMKPLSSTGSQGLVLESNHVRAEIVLSDESDRDILFSGLIACLPLPR